MLLLPTGVNVRSSGRAGEDASIQIRGVGSLSNNAPLWEASGCFSPKRILKNIARLYLNI